MPMMGEPEESDLDRVKRQAREHAANLYAVAPVENFESPIWDLHREAVELAERLSRLEVTA